MVTSKDGGAVVKKLALLFGAITVATLNVIVFAGSGLSDASIGQRLIAVAVPIMDASLIVSSVLFGRLLIGARGFRVLGLLFILNLAAFAAVEIVVGLTGRMPPRWLLFGADVWWLNLYLVTLSRTWPVTGQSAA